MTVNEQEPRYPTEIIQEGKARVLVPKLKDFVKQPSDYAPSKAPVFFNPVMELNRDLAVLAAQAHQRRLNRKITLCEPLTGTGLRGIRYALEIDGLKRTIIGDINENAFRLATHNVQINGLSKRITVKKKEANQILAAHNAPRKRFDYIDIDPFGSPVPFLDSAIRALRNHGMLALTATDMASLCGVHPRACLRKYGGRPLRTEYCHELAVRLLSGCVASVGAKYDIGTQTVFSHRGEHYVRVYVTINYSARNADESLENMGFVLHCFNCSHRETVKGYPRIEKSRECSECGSRLSVAGPLWVGNIFDPDFCALMQLETERRKLKSARKIENMLTLIRSEADSPVGYYVIDQMCDSLNLPVPPVKTVAHVIEREGFDAALTHFNSRGVRSDIPARKLAKILQGLADARRSG